MVVLSDPFASPVGSEGSCWLWLNCQEPWGKTARGTWLEREGRNTS
jgi:hypothetical protein